jgi:hypothetical protein
MKSGNSTTYTAKLFCPESIAAILMSLNLRSRGSSGMSVAVGRLDTGKSLPREGNVGPRNVN